MDELCTLMKKLGFSPNEDKVREIVAKVDANGNGQLEFDEFCEFLKVRDRAEIASARRPPR